jgi:hypothetical protein
MENRILDLRIIKFLKSRTMTFETQKNIQRACHQSLPETKLSIERLVKKNIIIKFKACHIKHKKIPGPYDKRGSNCMGPHYTDRRIRYVYLFNAGLVTNLFYEWSQLNEKERVLSKKLNTLVEEQAPPKQTTPVLTELQTVGVLKRKIEDSVIYLGLEK